MIYPVFGLKRINAKQAITLAMACTTAIGVYTFGPKVYKVIEAQINDMINEEILACIILMATPNYLINKLNFEERVPKFRKKARLMSLKSRIVARLEFFLSTQRRTLSCAHINQLQKNVNVIKRAFDSLNFIDYSASFFTENVELDYLEPSYIEKIIENHIYASIILSSKPIDECTLEEKLKRIKRQEGVNRLIEKKLGCLSQVFLLHIDQTANMLFG